MLEISVIRNNNKVWEYSSLNKKDKRKVYNMAILGLAMINHQKLKINKLDFTFFKMFGFSVNLILCILAIAAAIALYKTVMNDKAFTLESFLKELLWLLIAIIPGLIGLMLMALEFKFLI